MARIGFVGLGTMGRPMAQRLVDSGHELRVYDRAPAAAAALTGAGVIAVDSPLETAEGSAAVMLSLPGPAEVLDAITGEAGVLSADSLPAHIVDLSTNSVANVRALAATAEASGVVFVDAPVSGGSIKAADGTLSVLVGADEQEFAAIGSLLEAIGTEIFRVGPVGSGTIAKLVNNQLFLSASVLLQEAFLMGSAAGMEPSRLLTVLRASSAGTYTRLAPLLLGRQFDDVVFRLDLAAKDVRLAVETADDVGTPVPVTRAALDVYERAVEAGLGAEVFHATLKQLETEAGVEVPVVSRRKAP